MIGASQLFALLPVLITAVGAILTVVLISVSRRHAPALIMTLIVLGSSIAAAIALGISGHVPLRATPLLTIDTFALFFMGLVGASAFVTALFSFAYLKSGNDEHREEFYPLLLFATIGAQVLAASAHFASFILGLELLSVSLYAMIAFRKDSTSVEAGLKYLVLAGASAAFILFGMALVYFNLGTMRFTEIAILMKQAPFQSPLLIAGITMIVVGVGFKLSLVPFHMWVSDIFQGAPPAVSGFIATASKGAVFALLMRSFRDLGLHNGTPLTLIFWILAAASMCLGNLLALLQKDPRRVLAYSSIAHMGYLLVAFLAAGSLADSAVSYYLTAYTVTMLIAFGTLSLLPRHINGGQVTEAYGGLIGGHPVLAVAFVLSLFSLSGIPLTAGFVGKFLVLTAGAANHYFALILIMVLASAVGIFYYLRIAYTVLTSGKLTMAPLSIVGMIVLVVLSGGLVWLGIYPSSLLQVIHSLSISSF